MAPILRGTGREAVRGTKSKAREGKREHTALVRWRWRWEVGGKAKGELAPCRADRASVVVKDWGRASDACSNEYGTTASYPGSAEPSIVFHSPAWWDLGGPL